MKTLDGTKIQTTKPVAHLHVHSDYSLLDGAARIGDLAKRAAELNQPALGLTDHGVMSGCVELQEACAKEGIKPVFGCEVYFVDDRLDRAPGKYERNHLTLLAETNEGYRNLMRISSAGFLEGSRRGKPGVDLEVLARHSDGIIALTGCLASRFVKRIVDNGLTAAREHAGELIDIFGPDDVYFEIQENDIEDQDFANPRIAGIAKEFGRPLIATADVHYLRQEDFYAHQAMLCVQTKSTIAEPMLTFDRNEFWLKSNEEMAADFAYRWPGAIESTIEVAERSNVELELGGWHLPQFPCPGGADENEYLRELVFSGLADQYGDPIPAEAAERAEHELRLINERGWASFFLIIWDLVKHAKENGIAVGPGRGSAAGSIVVYALNITEVDPIRHNLLFERFVNSERAARPDIDIDFSVHGRTEMLGYLTEKYGSDRVARIATFGRMFPRAAVRDAARVLGHDYATGQRLAKLIPDLHMGRSPSFKDCLEPGQELARANDQDETAREIIDLAKGFENITRNVAIHAAAVVIADRPLTDIVPLQLVQDRAADEDDAFRTTTQCSMRPVETLGLLKQDFLGLRTLDVIDEALDNIERSGKDRPDISKIPLDDAKTYELLAAADTIGVFQFESEGMREALKIIRPTEFNDMIALVALYRPGAMQHIGAYARRKRKEEAVHHPDPRLSPILDETYGIPIYQEQTMQISTALAGFSGPMADDLRKAMGKKDRKMLAVLREAFLDGCHRSGTASAVAKNLWGTLFDAVDWNFNKAHASSYALIAYRTAWLKTNYPAEYMAAILSSAIGTKSLVPTIVSQCRSMGIDVRPPDVNLSDGRFTVADGVIHFGLETVNGLDATTAAKVVAARERGGPFKSTADFRERVGNQALTTDALRNLINAGAFDSLDAPQATSAGEKEALGFYLTGHPIHSVRAELFARVEAQIVELDHKPDGEILTIGGMIVEADPIETSAGNKMMFARLDDLTGQVDVVVFEKALNAAREHLHEDAVVLIRGRVDRIGGKTRMVALEVSPVEPAPETNS